MKQRIDQLKGRRDHINSELLRCATQTTDLTFEYNITSETLDLFITGGELARNDIKNKIGGLASSAMKDVFGNNSGAEVEFSQTKTGYTARITTFKDGISGDPMTSDGGSVCSIMAISLQIAFLHKLGMPPVLMLDEPLVGLDEENIEAAIIWLAGVASELGLQVIVISHEWMDVWERLADNIIVLSKLDKKSIDSV